MGKEDNPSRDEVLRRMLKTAPTRRGPIGVSKKSETPKYSATIFDENGVDQGPIDLPAAENDEQARDLAKKAGLKWVAEHGIDRATVQISRGGYGFSVRVP